MGAGLLAVRLPDPWGDMAGDLLYAVALYALLVVVAPRLPRPTVALVTVLGCWAVEALQATPLVAAATDALPAARWVLGTTFAVRDLLLYAAGAAVALLADGARGRRRPAVVRPARTSG